MCMKQAIIQVVCNQATNCDQRNDLLPVYISTRMSSVPECLCDSVFKHLSIDGDYVWMAIFSFKKCIMEIKHNCG